MHSWISSAPSGNDGCGWGLFASRWLGLGLPRPGAPLRETYLMNRLEIGKSDERFAPQCGTRVPTQIGGTRKEAVPCEESQFLVWWWQG